MKLKSLIIILFITGMTQIANSQPVLEIPNADLNLGIFPQNSTIVHDFWFKSTGSETLKISEIRTGCACAVLPLERKSIAPGDSMKVTMTWNVEVQMGRALIIPRIYTNAGDVVYKIEMRGLVIDEPESSPIISVLPYRLEFAKIYDRDIDSIDFQISNKFEHDLMLRKTSPSSDKYKIILPEVINGLSAAIGTIILNKEYADTEFISYLTFEATDPSNTKITVPIRRKIYK